MIRRDAASERQVQSAAPQESTWLAANAGSGKTKVLTDRVARLLLAGTEPQKVLCLTYTKAAAAEMQNRLLKRLGAWAMLDDAALRAELAALGDGALLDAEGLARARRLFAQAIETPGGLKIQTIHAFCGALLRRFPLEAGVSHGFAELDDRSAAHLREEVLEEIAAGPEQAVFDALLRHFSGEDLGGLIDEIGRNRAFFEHAVQEGELRKALGLPVDLVAEGLPALVFTGEIKPLVETIVPLLMRESSTMQTLAHGLAALDFVAPGRADLEVLYDLFLTKEGGIRVARLRAKPLTKGALAALGPELSEAVMALAENVRLTREMEFGMVSLERALALNQFARVLLPRLAQRKAQGGWLDFDDLIERAGGLLSDSSVAQWVLFRLDGGIDHILVDEAQDTSPGQWRVIERLADEFTAGEGARGTRRTIFVVGDRKQSIYSFQGADLAHFEAVKSRFSQKFAAIGRPLQSTALLHSFRSSLAILRLVDVTFAQEAAPGLGGAPEHFAYHETMPGRVDLWPAVPQPEKPPEDDWENPVDLPGEDSATVVLARAVAAEIRAMVDRGVQIPGPDGARPVHAGDFLVLVQRRSGLFFEIIRACKEAGLAVAGADRLKLGGELAVRDIVSVLAFLATPEDDLALAEALRSPLFDWTEDALFRLAHGREGYLWQALRAGGAEMDTAREVLRDLLDQADFLRPYDLIERLLTRHAGRDRLLARLGPEAEEGIDELIAQALAFERKEVPSLTGFLAWLGADEIEIKRQLEGAGRAIRVMTVHGAKGLEAPIVILPDTSKLGAPRTAQIGVTTDGVAFWKAASKQAPEGLAQLQAEEQERARHERLRLLYVALTRAEKWLIVATAGEGGEADDSWYALIARGMKTAGTETVEALSEAVRRLGPVQRFAHGTWPAEGARVEDQAAATVILPDWVSRRAANPPDLERPLAASDLGGAKALPGEALALGQDAALRFGRQLHLLLEHLPHWPENAWSEVLQDLLGFGEDRVDPADTEPLLTAARRVLRAVDEAGYLGPDTLAEVEITAVLPELGNRRLHGTIDRLHIQPDRLRVLDYKSNAVVPRTSAEVPLGLVRQMAAYRATLRQIYPDRAVECALLWTATGEIMPLPDAQLDAALRSPTGS